MSQTSSQENQIKKYEVKILKQIEYLPSVFMVKHLNGEVTKVSILAKYFENCTNYISRSKLTFSGCFKYIGDELLQTRGIYYTPAPPIFSVSKRNKITRRLMADILFVLVILLHIFSLVFLT